MSTELVAAPQPGMGTMPDWRACTALAEKLADSNIIPAHLRKKPGDILVILLTGQELGIGPMTALRSVHVLDGKPMMSADLMAAVALRSPDCVQFQCVESTEKRAVYHAKRRGDAKPTETVFTIEDAKAARLLGRDNWTKYQKAMLRARCCAAAARERFPDVLAGVYDNDELGGNQAPPPASAETTVHVVDDAGESEKPKTAPKTLADLKPPVTPQDRPRTTGPAVDLSEVRRLAAPDDFTREPDDHEEDRGEPPASLPLQNMAQEAVAEVFDKTALQYITFLEDIGDAKSWRAWKKKHGAELKQIIAGLPDGALKEGLRATANAKKAAFDKAES